jgi:urease accessory protein
MSAHLPLMIWLSPSFPVGAFAYSHGLEWGFEAGDLTDAATLRDWLDALISHGSLRNDLILFANAFRAAASGSGAGATTCPLPPACGGEGLGMGGRAECASTVSPGGTAPHPNLPHRKSGGKEPALDPDSSKQEALVELCELALALANSAERRLETVTQGNAFVAALRAAWPCDAIERLRSAWPDDVAYPLAVGVASAGHGLPLRPSLEAYGLACVANLVSASVRLGIIGQTDGQRVTAALVPALHGAAQAAETATLDEIGGCCLRSDIAALRHETQYSRLFRS